MYQLAIYDHKIIYRSNFKSMVCSCLFLYLKLNFTKLLHLLVSVNFYLKMRFSKLKLYMIIYDNVCYKAFFKVEMITYTISYLKNTFNLRGGVLSVMFIIVGNELGNQSSIPGWFNVSLHDNALEKNTNPPVLSQLLITGLADWIL